MILFPAMYISSLYVMIYDVRQLACVAGALGGATQAIRQQENCILIPQIYTHMHSIIEYVLESKDFLKHVHFTVRRIFHDFRYII